MGNTPSATTPANPPTGSTGGQGLCCACPIEGRVSTDGEGTYFNTNYPPYGETRNDCHLSFERNGSGGRVEVTIRYCLGYVEGADWQADGPRMHGFIQSAQVAWNRAARKFRLQIKQDGCPEQRLAIQFRFVTAPSVDDFDVSIYANGRPLPANPTVSDNRSSVDRGQFMMFYLNEQGDDLAWTMTHEFGHVMGQPDEYVELPAVGSPSSDGVTFAAIGAHPQASYHRTATQPSSKGGPSPTVIDLEPHSEGDLPGTYLFNTDSLMGLHLSENVFGESFFWVAIETEAMFGAQGTSVSAAIVPA